MDERTSAAESYPRQRGVDAGRLVGDGDDGQQTEVDARRNALDVDPERQPRHHHGENARYEHLYDVEADVALQQEHDLGTRVRACNDTTAPPGTATAIVRYSIHGGGPRRFEKPYTVTGS